MKALQMPIEEAVEQAVTECIKEDILAEFLKKNRAEAMEVSIFEYNEELHLANLRREGYEEGLEYGISQGITRGITQGITQGKAMAILELLEELGEVSEELKLKILDQTHNEVLSKWHKLAAKAKSVQEFEESIK